MSGGVGPTCSDINLPKEEEEEEESKNGTKKKSHFTKATKHRGGLFSFPQLNALAVIIVLSASGMVSPFDLIFAILSIFYIYFMSKFAFPVRNPKMEGPIFGEKNRVLGLYRLTGTIIGLLLPIAYIFEGIFEGDKEGIKAATPHVFLLASQVFTEGLASSARFSIPVRVFVPVFYNSRRIFTIMEWLSGEIGKVEEVYKGSGRRLSIGRGLAAANMFFWCFNLFGFVLPVYLPRAFQRYYSGVSSKAED